MKRQLAVKKEFYALAGLVVLLAAALGYLGFFDAGRLSRGAANLAAFARGMVPPDLGILPMALRALGETLVMAFAGTALGFLYSLPLGVMGTGTLFPRPVVLMTRFVMAAIRTIPSLVWAVLLVVVVGLGPLAGTLALAVYTVGYLGKLYAEFFDGVDPEVLEAVRGAGANRLHLARYVIWPETANSVLSQLLFMLEYNVRVSSILGFVGAGGIGYYMYLYVNSLEYQRLSTLLILILALVLLMDVASAWLRRRYLLAQ
jgi:phosphonate transport system permease protein